jgi:hypothetical protein
MSRAPSRSRWLFLLRPRWLAWHLFAVCAAAGMLWLGDWQLHRAVAGNELSWAYTFEWPLFTVLGIAFWVRTVVEELRSPGPAGLGVAEAGPDAAETDPAGPEPAEAGPATRAGPLTRSRPVPAAGTQDDSAAVAYAARLSAEVRRHGRWHGLR